MPAATVHEGTLSPICYTEEKGVLNRRIIAARVFVRNMI